MEQYISNREGVPRDPSIEGLLLEKVSSETEEERDRLITLAGSVFTEHFRRLEIPLQKEFPKERFRFLSQQEFDAEFPRLEGALGMHGVDEDFVIVDQNKSEELFLTILHEMTHDVAVKKSKFDVNGKLVSYINGYMVGKIVTDSAGKSSVKLHFDGLNEGVVEMTALRVAARYSDDFDDFGISKEDLGKALTGHQYKDATIVVSSIVSVLARETNSDELEIWKQIERGQYTGEMAWVYEVDRVFGKGSLRVLDSLIAWPKTDTEREYNKKILKYFQMKDADERAAFQSEIY